MEKEMLELIDKYGKEPWLFDIRTCQDDAGTRIEIEVDVATYPKTDPIPRTHGEEWVVVTLRHGKRWAPPPEVVQKAPVIEKTDV